MSHKPQVSAVVAAVKGAEPEPAFLACLVAYMRRVKGRIYVCPMDGIKKDDELSEVFDSPDYTIVDDERRLGEHIRIRHWGSNPAQVNPMVGIDSLVSKGQSLIVPSPKQYFRTVSRLHGHPEIVLTTGACTLPLYKTERGTLGKRAHMQHTIGAAIVETTRDGCFFARHIRLKHGKGFTDLGTRVETFGKGGMRFVQVRAEALVLGDLHIGEKTMSQDCRMANLAMADLYEPRYLVLHDVMDGYSVNHHELENIGVQAGLANECKTLKSEFAEVHAELKALSESSRRRDCQTVVVRSNHDEFAERYIMSGHHHKDRLNRDYCTALYLAHQAGKDIFTEGVLSNGKLPKVRFLQRQESFKVGDWELGSHGDKGSNGSKANTKMVEQLAGCGEQVIVGHQHSPQVFRGAIVVGTTEKLPTDKDPVRYTASNPSSWLHANAVVWPDGSAQLLVIVGPAGYKWTAM